MYRLAPPFQQHVTLLLIILSKTVVTSVCLWCVVASFYFFFFFLVVVDVISIFRGGEKRRLFACYSLLLLSVFVKNEILHLSNFITLINEFIKCDNYKSKVCNWVRICF